MYQATGELTHPGEKGLLRELFLRRVIEALLPAQFGVGSGVIVGKWERQSAQTDLLICDKRTMPPFLEEHGHGIYPFDSVLRIIEVKSTLDHAALRQFRSAAWRVHPKNRDGLKMAGKGTLEAGHSYYPLVGLCAYESKVSDIEKVLDEDDMYLSSNRVVRVLKDSWVEPEGGKGEVKLGSKQRREYSVSRCYRDLKVLLHHVRCIV